jgi:SAM-dependent methyltransferase
MILRASFSFALAMLAAGIACAGPADPPQPASAGSPPPEAAAEARLEAPPRRPDVPYVPTPHPIVDGMLQLAGVRAGDVVYDLGCGDGRIVVRALQAFEARRGVCVDIDPQRIVEARENARAAGVEARIQFVEGDLFDVHLHEATVVTLYLLPSINLALRPKLLEELAPGSRVVSHDFAMGEWEPERELVVEGRSVFLWIISDPPEIE